MSLITCCPACGTMFKVVPDQLKISEGWVRCGHCAEIFDATAHLQQPGALAQALGVEGAAPPQETAAPPSPAPSVDDRPQAAYRTEPMDDDAVVPVHVPEAPPARAAGADAGADADARAVVQPVFAREDRAGSKAFLDDLVSVPPADADVPPAGRGEERLPQERSADPTSLLSEFDEDKVAAEREPELHDLGFVRQARRKAFWSRPAVRAGLGLVALALLALLAVQVAIAERDRLAALQPGLRPLLERACEPLGCRIGPPRQIEAIVIDTSSFGRLRSDAYRLSFTLKNQAATEVAMPAVEVTLTDTQDQPVVRRVLEPREYGATTEALAAASEWSGTLALTLAANGSTGRIAGYRLLAFYP